MGYGWGTAVGVVLSWFSPKHKVRRLKDELDKLERERSKIFITKATVKRSRRLTAINRAIDDKHKRLQNFTTG